MIRSLPKSDRDRVRHLARRQWRTIFMPFAILQVEGYGRSLVIMRRLDTRWSDRHGRRIWRAPAALVAGKR